MSNDEYRDNLYSPLQSKVLTLIPMFTGSLSAIGSSVIIYIILSDRKLKLKRVYHRLLLAYSSVDFCFSINFGLSALVVPRGTPGVWGALGNQATCEASGFVTQFGQSSALYAAFLSLYYLLILRYKVREETIAKRIEPTIHLFAFFFPFTFAIAMLCLDMYNPSNINIGWCFINVYPADCLRREEVECKRGEDYAMWLALNNAPFFVYFAIVLVSSVLTYLKVRSFELRTSSQWTFNSQSRHRSKEISIQAGLYIVAFLFTYALFGVSTLVGPSAEGVEENRHIYFPLSVLVKIFLPLQGFWNCIIFVRPRYTALKRRNRHLKCWQIVKQIVFYSNEAAQRKQKLRSQIQESESADQICVGVSSMVIVDCCANGKDDFTPEIEDDDQTQEMGDSDFFAEDGPRGFPKQVFRMDILADSSSQGSSHRFDSSSGKQQSSTHLGREQASCECAQATISEVAAEKNEIATGFETAIPHICEEVASIRNDSSHKKGRHVEEKQVEDGEPRSLLESSPSCREACLRVSCDTEESCGEKSLPLPVAVTTESSMAGRPIFIDMDTLDERK
jgi:hypothetical protein